MDLAQTIKGASTIQPSHLPRFYQLPRFRTALERHYRRSSRSFIILVAELKKNLVTDFTSVTRLRVKLG
jgi:hypothetical protein